MAKLRVNNLAMSLDGYVAGRDQSIEEPLGVGGERLHEWVFSTPTWWRLTGEGPGVDTDGSTSDYDRIDERFMQAGIDGVGATIMGRNMFGPVRGPWGDEDWRGWWGEEPPYHHPVFVLTHHPRPPIEMQGGTTLFHFVTDGIEAALEAAFDAAAGQDVRLGGGASTVQQYLRAGLIDDLHVAVVPILLGAGERLFDDIDGVPERYECIELVASRSVAHVRFAPKR